MGKKTLCAKFTAFDEVKVTASDDITAKSVFMIRDIDGEAIRFLKPTKARGKKAAAEYVYSLDCSTYKAAVGARELVLKLEQPISIDNEYTLTDEPESGEPVFEDAEILKAPLFALDGFRSRYEYAGPLGVEYGASRSVFRVWSPFASKLKLNLYESGDPALNLKIEHDMTKSDDGVWETTVNGDLHGTYYTYSVTCNGITREVVDPYALSAGRNGVRGMILDLARTNPEGWNDPDKHSVADRNKACGMAGAVIYEAQLRDLTISPSSGVSPEHRGKFLGLTETGTVNGSGTATALDHIKAMGVTHVHFQPLFDFGSIDEYRGEAVFGADDASQYNWGYDPVNYNVPEGSYSTDPDDGAVRVTELKSMIMALHNAGLKVVLDVVYNHVQNASDCSFEALAPEYFFRTTEDGAYYYNGSGCGNETASERYMCRRFIVDSVRYWASEYKVDGFRFDLMGLHDIDTINEVCAELKKINPDIIVYGEGWAADESGLPPELAATIANAGKMPGAAVFNDAIRDGLKGDTSGKRIGFVSGMPRLAAAVYAGAAGATEAAPDEVYASLGKGRKAFAAHPLQNVNYVSSHDDATLWDKLNMSVAADRETLKAMNRLAAVAVLTGQGASFMLAGEEMLRSKPTAADNGFDNRPCEYLSQPGYYCAANSYRSPDDTNAIDWALADTNADTVAFYKQLIRIKTALPHFRIATTDKLAACLTINNNDLGAHAAAYAVKAPGTQSYAILVFNAGAEPIKAALPRAEYRILVDGDRASADPDAPVAVFKGDMFTVGARSAVMFLSELADEDVKDWAQRKPPAAQDLSAALEIGITVPTRVSVCDGEVTVEDSDSADN